ncbi:biogenesis of lysosome-related organelles complex 1 subunit 4-like isoform X2 [Varroa jacobsoni]|uniref:biogenesis of lysosome-related organelles complex 1 subunit 4-like isoform X2 n=1 Tax=Varroa jacobsoni TaxID=62625 RepID=UPI000BF97A33|nr:biogenesis of lysosome-related organelles complex 1 subunit 4-like isoform X2 [Varroa jacobsoni]
MFGANLNEVKMAVDQSDIVESLAKTTAASVVSLTLADLNESKAQLDERCDFLLTKLDAFNQLLKAVSERAEFLQMNLPKLIAARQRLKQVYSQVDQLEALVCDVRSSLAAMESKVEQAESLFITSYQQKIFKVFQSALGSANPSSSSGGQYRRQVRFEPPELFRVNDYFPSASDDGSHITVAEIEEANKDSKSLPESQGAKNDSTQ